MISLADNIIIPEELRSTEILYTMGADVKKKKSEFAECIKHERGLHTEIAIEYIKIKDRQRMN